LPEDKIRFYADQVKQLPISFSEKIETLKKVLEKEGIEWKEEYIDYLR